MTRKISLIIGMAVTALAVGVPTAFGEGRLAGSQEPTLATPNAMVEDGFAQAVAASLALQSARTYRDANERGSTQQVGVQSSLSGYRDANERGSVPKMSAFERGVVSGQLDLSTFNAFERATPVNALESNVSTYRDAFERGTPVAGSPDVPTITSGREIEWPQIGIGFGVGLLLALGLGLAMRMTPIRPAH